MITDAERAIVAAMEEKRKKRQGQSRPMLLPRCSLCFLVALRRYGRRRREQACRPRALDDLRKLGRALDLRLIDEDEPSRVRAPLLHDY